jgi:penicillin G amidase
MRARRLPTLLSLLALAACSTADATSSDDPLQALALQSLAQIEGELTVPGLSASVEVIRDRWGVPHIYAQNTEDLFFAQGFVAAQDRLWQMDWWRRTQEGRLAEVLGPAAFERDKRMRLLKYRGPFTDEEWTSYHPQAKRIFTAFANGVNAFIEQVGDNLPVEFKLTGLRPEPWTAETVVLRNPTIGHAASELDLARQVAELGVAEANRRDRPDPWDDLRVPAGLDVGLISEAAADAAEGLGGQLPRVDVLPEYQEAARTASLFIPDGSVAEPGSNNWVMGGGMTDTGLPYVVNDPHRNVILPSLRYVMHLVAPGWNVYGSSEPPFAGIHIGHNERLGWGLTITGTDQQDAFVEELNPRNPNEVRFDGRWEPMTVVTEQIAVKGEAPRTVELKFSRHGPIFYEDPVNLRAYAVRSALAEPGTASYLGGLRLAQAADCRAFLEEAMYWKYPSENLICGDVDGNIAWQASALTPNRKGWVGRLPVPGTGRYEWDGFRKELPKELNPERGFIATANNNIHTPGYAPPIMFKRPNPFERIVRVRQMIEPGRKYGLEDHKRMQHDPLSLEAAATVPVFQGWTSSNADVERARALIAGWDGSMTKESAAAAIYDEWAQAADEDRIRDGDMPAAERQSAIEAGLVTAIEEVDKAQGADWAQWRWGRANAIRLRHPVSSAFDLPDTERLGAGGSVAANGATYREIFDVSNWDRSAVTNVPGQSGQPGSPYYRNLLESFANAEYFDAVYTRPAVEGAAAHRLTLQPGTLAAR